MSKKIILQKKDRENLPTTESIKSQPKILTKSNQNENASSAITTVIPKKSEEEKPMKSMKSCLRILTNWNLTERMDAFLDGENTDFLVVGFIGPANVGKSFLANFIASEATEGKFSQREIFSTQGSSNDLAIDCFITKDRIIILDTSPLLSNLQKKDMINAELDDIKTITFLLHVCHLLINVNAGVSNDLSISRLIHQAENFSPSEFKHRPLISSIANKVQPGKTLRLDTKINEFNDILIFPDLKHSSVNLHCDVDEKIQRLQEIVFMKKRFSMIDNENEQFTESIWWKRFTHAVDKLKKGDYFSRKYEGLKDKFHQSTFNE